MRTKPNQLRLFALFLLFYFYQLEATIAQSHFSNFTSESIGLGGISVSLKNPWSISSNPGQAIPKDKILTGLNWTNLFNGSGLNYLTASCQKRFDKTGIGVQISQTGYAISSWNTLYFSMAQKWNKKVQTGLSFQRKWLKVNELQNQLVSINATIGAVVMIQNTQVNGVIENILPNKKMGISEMEFTTGFKQPLSENVNIYSEISIQQLAIWRLSIGFDYALTETLKISLGAQKNPNKIGFGLQYDLKKSIKLTAAGDLNWQVGATNSASLSWAFD